MNRAPRLSTWLRPVAVWAVAIAVTLVLMGWVLPWAGERGYVGRVIRENLRQGREATPLFYSESQRTLDISESVAKRRAAAANAHGDTR